MSPFSYNGIDITDKSINISNAANVLPMCFELINSQFSRLLKWEIIVEITASGMNRSNMIASDK